MASNSENQKSLVIVESPAKAKTINKILGKGFEVIASYGHVRDLPQKELGVDIDNGFAPKYVVQRSKQKHITAIRKKAEESKSVYLAPDPDREGEAICWHIAEILHNTKGETPPVYRIAFNEITKKAVLQAMESPGEIDIDRVNAQQARRILDRLVGYRISPLLWRRVKGASSAGRVQSVAVRLICEREEEIRKFVPVEYWTITGDFESSERTKLSARLAQIDGKRVLLGEATAVEEKEEKDENGDVSAGDCLRIANEAQAKEMIVEIRRQAYSVSSVVRKERKRNPFPPYITSTLEQDASRRLDFNSDRTMRVAQTLYEGVDIDKETVGLITYMRTDSVRIAPEALDETREFVQSQFGADYIPGKARTFRVKKGAQDAHECIRPTSVSRTPTMMKPHLNTEQYNLYELIWRRFVACQMSPAVFDQTSIDVAGGRFVFRATGSILRFDGFLVVYSVTGDGDTVLPSLNEGSGLSLLDIDSQQHFTKPPARYNDASLIKILEEKGIGRPSTYATIVRTIVDRSYVERIDKRFKPTELGELVNRLLVEHFPDIVDVGFTAKMEENLDEVERGGQDWQKLLAEFYGPFSEDLERARSGLLDTMKEMQETVDKKCPECGKNLVKKWGRRGWFLACPGYPDCKYTESLDGTSENQATEEICDKCGSPMVIRNGKSGRFLACSAYPKCKNAKGISIGLNCPKENCGGFISERRSRYGKVFYGCSNYPNCDFVAWKKPVPEKCPDCGSNYLLENITKRWGHVYQCPNKECKYRRSIAEKTDEGTEE